MALCTRFGTMEARLQLPNRMTEASHLNPRASPSRLRRHILVEQAASQASLASWDFRRLEWMRDRGKTGAHFTWLGATIATVMWTCSAFHPTTMAKPGRSLFA